MAISPDGKQVAVSASTANVVHILDTNTGEEVGRFPSGDSPHENNYSRRRQAHLPRVASASSTRPADDPPDADTTKGERYFQVVDAKTNKVIERVDMGKKLAEARLSRT